MGPVMNPKVEQDFRWYTEQLIRVSERAAEEHRSPLAAKYATILYLTSMIEADIANPGAAGI